MSSSGYIFNLGALNLGPGGFPSCCHIKGNVTKADSISLDQLMAIWQHGQSSTIPQTAHPNTNTKVVINNQ